MEISVKNLGAIKSGKVNLNKNLTILTGPNNTGKSYLTYLIYSVHKLPAFSIERQDRADWAQAFAHIMNANDSIHLSGNGATKFFFKDLLAKNESYVSKSITNKIKENYIKIFLSLNIKPSIQIKVTEFPYYDKYNSISGFELNNDKITPFFGSNKSFPHPLAMSELQSVRTTQDFASFYAAGTISNQLFNTDFFGKAYSFPAERTAINLFARDIVAKKAGSRDDMALRVLAGEDIEEIARSIKEEQNGIPKYPLVVNDYLNFVNSFEGLPEVSDFDVLAILLEDVILGGKIGLSEFKALVFTPHGSKRPLELHETSSLIKSLSFVVIYLRYFAAKGDLVIIDEPEINLHPNLQVAIARIFAKMVNAGLRVVLSTHSDYLVKELNNLVLLQELQKRPSQKAFIKKSGYSLDDMLDRQQVDAYYLDEGRIQQLNVQEIGIVVPSINSTISTIDNISEELYFKLSVPEPTSKLKIKKS